MVGTRISNAIYATNLRGGFMPPKWGYFFWIRFALIFYGTRHFFFEHTSKTKSKFAFTIWEVSKPLVILFNSVSNTGYFFTGSASLEFSESCWLVDFDRKGDEMQTRMKPQKKVHGCNWKCIQVEQISCCFFFVCLNQKMVIITIDNPS